MLENGCHNLLSTFMNLSAIAILNIIAADYCHIINKGFSKFVKLTKVRLWVYSMM